MNLPCRCAVIIINNCIAMATKPLGGRTSRLSQSKSQRSLKRRYLGAKFARPDHATFRIARQRNERAVSINLRD
jgi:hypothetical protein